MENINQCKNIKILHVFVVSPMPAKAATAKICSYLEYLRRRIMRNPDARKEKKTEFDSGTMHVPRQTEIPSSHPSVFYFSRPLFLSCVSAPSTFICYFFPDFQCCHGFLRRPEPPALCQLLQRTGSILNNHERQVSSKPYETWQI